MKRNSTELPIVQNKWSVVIELANWNCPPSSSMRHDSVPIHRVREWRKFWSKVILHIFAEYVTAWIWEVRKNQNMHIPKMSKTIFYVYAKYAKTKPSIPAGYANKTVNICWYIFQIVSLPNLKMTAEFETTWQIIEEVK
jgi:hypothetical protein